MDTSSLVSGVVVSSLYILGTLVLLLVLAFLAITGYLHYVHWKYSHFPQPKRPRYEDRGLYE